MAMAVRARRQLIPAVLALLCAVAGAWLFLQREPPEAAALRAIEDLARAIENHDPPGFESRIHENYSGWGGSRDRVAILFRANVGAYRRITIKLRNFDAEMTNEGTRAVVDFEWQAGSRIQDDGKWTPARAVLEIASDGEWKLLDLATDIPYLGH